MYNLPGEGPTPKPYNPKPKLIYHNLCLNDAWPACILAKLCLFEPLFKIINEINIMNHIQPIMRLWSLVLLSSILSMGGVFGSSHREAPLIANDPLADNTDVYAFRSPDDPNTVTLIANYVPLQLPHGGPNYYRFGDDVRYEIHVDNDISTTGDDIIYRLSFSSAIQEPNTFFNLYLSGENLIQEYIVERSMDGGATFQTILTSGMVPPYRIGPRSIESPVGINSTYESLWNQAIETASTGEKIFCGPVDDPFFVDLGGIFDLGDAPRQNGTPSDGVAGLNVSAIIIQVPIATLQKDHKDVSQAANILDGDFVIGVWASASRQKIRTLADDGTPMYSGDWVQVSRLGMPLTNEAVIPIGAKDEWNSRTPYNENPAHFEYFYNPELALYMDDALFGGAVPAFDDLRVQRNALQAFDFGNGNDGLFPLKGNPALAGTALDDAVFGTLLLPGPGKPRSVDLWPAFHTGVPNVAPYQLATGKTPDNPLSAGKPFINNFLPNGGDMLRLNMATPITPRTDPNFSSNGLITAAVLGLTDPTYANTNIEFIPNMDGFPNGRRLEDDVTRIELQAVSGIVLAAIGLWYDDYTAGQGNSPLTQDLLNVLGYSTGVEENDTTFDFWFPYVQMPWEGTGKTGGKRIVYQQPTVLPPTPIQTGTQVTSLVLYDAKADTAIRALQDGEVIDLSTLPTRKINIIAETNQSNVGSVVFDFEGDPQFSIDDAAPFALAGDNGNGNFFTYKLKPGQYSITATPYSHPGGAGVKGQELSLNFSVIKFGGKVSSFTLVNADTDTDIGPLMDGDVVDISALGCNLSIRANTDPTIVGSVNFRLDNQAKFKLENFFPYAIAGDQSGDYFPVYLSNGKHKVKATPYAKKNRKGGKGQSLLVKFTVVNSGPSSRTIQGVQLAALKVYPNPTTDRFILEISEAQAGEVSLGVYAIR